MWDPSGAAQMEDLLRAHRAGQAALRPRYQPATLHTPRWARGGGAATGPALVAPSAPVVPPVQDFTERNRRASMIAFCQVVIPADLVPDGSLASRADRQQIAKSYRAILASAPPVAQTGEILVGFAIMGLDGSGSTGVQGDGVVEFGVSVPAATGTTS